MESNLVDLGGGLKMILYAPYKHGKTVFCLTAVGLGHMGVIDSEGRWGWYTIPHPTHTPKAFPFDNPRAIRLGTPMIEGNPRLKECLERGKDNVIFLVQTSDQAKARQANASFIRVPEIATHITDSGTKLWDLLMAQRDTSDPKKTMLSWVPIKEVDRRYKDDLEASRKHCIITAHTQEKLRLVENEGRSEFVSDGVVPWLEKKSAYWSDIVATMVMPPMRPNESKPPDLMIVGEGIGGAGGMVRGAKLKNPTFPRLLEIIGGVPAPITDPPQTETTSTTTDEVSKIVNA